MSNAVTTLPVTKVPATEEHGERLEYNNRWMDQVISNLRPGRYLMEFTSTRRRSTAQLKYYRGVVLPAFSQGAAGGSYTTDEWHIILGNMFLQREVSYQGKIYFGIRSTSDEGGMTTDEFSEFLEKVILYGFEEHQLNIPEPKAVGIE